MAEIRWTEQAAEDLEAIAEYIARDSPHYASLFCLNTVAKIERLELFPMLGRIVPETNDPAIREILMGNYRIIYRLVGETVEILSIYHGARILDPDTLTLPK
jgi:toxin ParE1/3/4